MAEIYRARTLGIGGFEKYYAIKKILPHLTENQEFITMLIDEAKIVVSLQHANIVQVLELGKVGDSYFIAMEYVHGMDLVTILKTCAYNNFMMPFEHTVHIGMSACSGLYHAHSKKDSSGATLGIIHRDISPHNVLLSYDGEVKVIDFGVAKASIKMTHTMSGIIKGKLLYMAPEQAMAKQIDHRADLFALGLVLYKMTTHQLPFEGENEFQIYNKLVQGKVVPPKKHNPKIPDKLSDLILKSLKKKPEQRFQDAFRFRNALGSVLSEIAPGYSSSRLARFMETYFPPRPLQNPEPIEPAPDVSLVGSPPPTAEPGYPDLFSGASPALMTSAPAQSGAAQAQGQRGPDLPYGDPNSWSQQGYAPPGAQGPAAPASPSALRTPAGGLVGPRDPTVQVRVPYGVSLLNQETVPASAGLRAEDLFPDGFPPTGSGDYDPRPLDAELKGVRRSLGAKVFVGVLVFLVLLFGGIVGTYHVLEFIAGSPGGSGGRGRPRVEPVAALDSGPGGGDAADAADQGAPDVRTGSVEVSDREPGAGEIRVQLHSLPPGADVLQGVDEYVGQTNLAIIKRQKRGAKLRFTFQKDGYRTERRMIPLDRDRKVLVRLRRR